MLLRRALGLLPARKLPRTALLSTVDTRPLPRATERLQFRWFNDDARDRELAWALWGDPDVNALLGSLAGADRAATDARLLMEITTGREHGVQYWPCFMNGDHVGCVGLRQKGDPAERCFELGIHIGRRFWRRGFGREAAVSAISHGFDLGAASLFGGHFPTNRGSARLLTSLGFVYTHDGLFDGLPDTCYRLTRETWSSRS